MLRDMEAFYAGTDLTTFSPVHQCAARLSRKEQAKVVEVGSHLKGRLIDGMLNQFGVTTLMQRSKVMCLCVSVSVLSVCWCEEELFSVLVRACNVWGARPLRWC